MAALAGNGSESILTVLTKQSFSRESLIACGHGELFGGGNARLPLPPMLMFDRIVAVEDTGGAHKKGYIEAEFDIRPDLWFFGCHFEGDPVMPGCLGLDALWQLVGFYLAWRGAPGLGRALGVGEVKFSGQITPEVKLLKYRIDFKKIIIKRLVIGVGDGTVFADNRPIYAAKDLRVGLFKQEDLAKPGDGIGSTEG